MIEQEYDYDLAHECATWILLHKMIIIETKLIMFYSDLVASGVKISCFEDEAPKDKARQDVINLLTDREKFEKKYLEAWEELKYHLP